MRRVLTALCVFALGLGLALGACKSGSGSGSTEPSAEDMEQARQIFSQRCVSCHGETGAGDGPASAGLNPQPRNYTSPEWQDSVTDEHLERIIVQGGAAVGLSAAMPNNPDLRDKPGVVRGLRQIIRGFRAAE